MNPPNRALEAVMEVEHQYFSDGWTHPERFNEIVICSGRVDPSQIIDFRFFKNTPLSPIIIIRSDLNIQILDP